MGEMLAPCPAPVALPGHKSTVLCTHAHRGPTTVSVELFLQIYSVLHPHHRFFMSIKAAGDGGRCQPQPQHGFAGVVQAVGEAHASDPTEPESPPGSCSKPFNFRHVCSCPIAFLLQRCHGLRGGTEPARGAPRTAQKITQLGRYKSPEADILISFLMSCINAIQAELSWCPVNIHQSRCKASGHSARTKAVSGVSGRACHLPVFGKKPGEERTREQTRLSVCLWVVSELTPWVCRTSPG